MKMTAEINRFLSLDRLLRGDRIIWQHRDGDASPEAAWWDKSPQLGRPVLWLSTVKLFHRRGLIVRSELRPRTSNIGPDWKHADLFVATPAATSAFIDMDVPPRPTGAPGRIRTRVVPV